jgi:hypothetical protein
LAWATQRKSQSKGNRSCYVTMPCASGTVPITSRGISTDIPHGKLAEAPTSLSMGVGVDTHDFRPWHFGEINLLMTEKAKARGELQSAAPSNSQ